MGQRKRIALLTAHPESIHGKRIITGILRQCEKYGYDLCVFAALTNLDITWGFYRHGESNIFNLANYSLFDGVIVDTSSLTGDHSGETIARIRERLAEAPWTPAVALEMPIEGLAMIQNRNESILREMCRHIIEDHGKKKLCILTGPKDNPAAISRLEVFLDEISAHGLTVAPEHIVYGDFWYFSGDKLADDILSGAVSMPEAVICASDHMALGLMDKLVKNGIRIPEDLPVISFEATEEGASNKITLSSYEANDSKSAADAVDHIRRIIEPEAELLPYEDDPSKMFHAGMSCGCEPNYLRSARVMRHALYMTSRNYADAELINQIDIGILMEGYVLEQFTASQTPDECMDQILKSTYMLNPFLNYYLCLTENWLDIEQDRMQGYPDRMRIAVAYSHTGGESHCAEEYSVAFDTAQMLPALSEEREEPSVFYFSPVHFNGKLMGYSVLQRDIHEDTVQINLVYRNWLRFVNNALEMIRSKKCLQVLSVRDEMTGLYNRRGMYGELEKMLRETESDNSTLFVCVIDMDGLKYINDTFGHTEGDFGIRLVSSAVAEIARRDEICVRAGGDEFYLIGAGQYTPEDMEQRIAEFSGIMERKSAASGKQYAITASIGAALRKMDKSVKVEDVINEADERMYRNKVARKKQRQ